MKVEGRMEKLTEEELENRLRWHWDIPPWEPCPHGEFCGMYTTVGASPAAGVMLRFSSARDGQGNKYVHVGVSKRSASLGIIMRIDKGFPKMLRDLADELEKA